MATNPQPKIGRVFNGKKIARTKPGMLPGPARVGEIIDCLNALLNMRVLLTDGQEASVTISDAGVVLQIPKTISSDESEPEQAGLLCCKITTLDSKDYFGATRWDGADYAGNEFFVAKSIPSRMPAEETVEAETFNYTYEDDNTRTSDDGTTTEAQVMFPRFVDGAIVFVIAVDFSGVSKDSEDLKYIEHNTAREWVKKYIVE